jgi:hypothetical protein
MAEALIGEVIPNPETKFFCHKCSAEIPRVLPVRGATIAANFCWGLKAWQASTEKKISTDSMAL